MQFFKKFPGEHAPGPPWSRFWYLSCLKITLPGKMRLKKVTKMDAPPEKISECAPDITHFQKQKPYLRPFPSLNVFAFS